MLKLYIILASIAWICGAVKTSNEEFNILLESIYLKYNATSVVAYIANATNIALFGSAGYAQRKNHYPKFDRYGRVKLTT